MKALEEQSDEEFVVGSSVKVSCNTLIKQGVIVSLAIPPKLVKRSSLTFSSVRAGVTNVLCVCDKTKTLFVFELHLEELLDLQERRVVVKEESKVKLNVNTTLAFLNAKMAHH